MKDNLQIQKHGIEVSQRLQKTARDLIVHQGAQPEVIEVVKEIQEAALRITLAHMTAQFRVMIFKDNDKRYL